MLTQQVPKLELEKLCQEPPENGNRKTPTNLEENEFWDMPKKTKDEHKNIDIRPEKSQHRSIGK